MPARNGRVAYSNFPRKRPLDPSKTTCTLYMQADHLFFEKYQRNVEMVIEQLTQHVQGVNEIYSAIGKPSS
jgi:disintegrin and metalloproteinase domain-containing protein 10